MHSCNHDREDREGHHLLSAASGSDLAGRCASLGGLRNGGLCVGDRSVVSEFYRTRRRRTDRWAGGGIMTSSFMVRRALATTASIALIAGGLMLQSGGLAMAQTATDAKIKALEDQVNQLQRSINELKASEAQSAAQAKAAADQAKAAAAQAQSAASQVAPPPPPVTAVGTPYPTAGAPPGVHFNVAGQDFQ